MIDGQNFFDQPVKNDMKTYNIRKIGTSHGNAYTSVCFLDYHCFNKSYKLIEIYLSKQLALDSDPKKIQQTNFTRNLDRDLYETIFLHYWRYKGNRFSKETVGVL